MTDEQIRAWLLARYDVCPAFTRNLRDTCWGSTFGKGQKIVVEVERRKV